MELVYHKGRKKNFGDDLNEDIWDTLLPGSVRERADVVLIGIGSILTEERLASYAHDRRKIFVLGSGMSYGRPPTGIDSWNVMAVRGPLTARVLGCPKKAVTDGAILLSEVERRTGKPANRQNAGTDIIFIPHRRSIRLSNWKAIARNAGMTYVSPELPHWDVLRAIRNARLVVTEAMHGAIIADTYRVPWVPISISPAFDEFKWRDWTRSMELPLLPSLVPAAHPVDRQEDVSIERVLQAAELSGVDRINVEASQESLQTFLTRRFAPDLKARLSAAQPSKSSRAMRAPLGWLFTNSNDASSEALQSVVEREPFLSQDAVFNEKLERMLGCVDNTIKIALA